MRAQFSIKKKKESASLRVTGDLTVSSAADMREQLLSFSQHQGELSVSLTEITLIDVSAVQLLYLFVTTCKQKNQAWSLNWPTDATIHELLVKTGIKNLLQ